MSDSTPKRREDESKTILLIGNSVGSTLRFRELLTRRGFSVRQASSKQEALDALATGHAELVVLDAGSYVALQRRADRLAAVNRLIRSIAASLDLGAVYDAFAKELKQLLSFTRMGIIVPETAGKQLKVLQLAADQPGKAKVGSVWSNGKGTGIEWVMSHRQPHIEPDLAERRLFVEDEVLLKEGIRSTIRLPLVMKGEVVGAFFLDDVEPGRYTEDDLELLIPLGEQLAIAIEQGRLFQEVHRLAITDELTDLFNHRHFYGQLEQELRRTRRYGHPLSLIMLDIDLFKKYNDLHGHLAGDEALRLIAVRLKNSTRGTDIVARYGGDEFGIILPETDLRRAWVQAERIRSVIERDPLNGRAAPDGNRLTVSLGVACLGPDTRKVEDLVRAADQALYDAKAAGGNRTSVA